MLLLLGCLLRSCLLCHCLLCRGLLCRCLLRRSLLGRSLLCCLLGWRLLCCFLNCQFLTSFGGFAGALSGHSLFHCGLSALSTSTFLLFGGLLCGLLDGRLATRRTGGARLWR